MNKLLIIILVVIVIAGGAFLLFKNQSNAPADETDATQSTVTSATEAPTSDAALDQLEKENDSENFSDVNTDFGAEVNTATQ